MGGLLQNAQTVIDGCFSFLQEFRKAQVTSSSNQQGRGNLIWEGPENDIFKINFDGALNRAEAIGEYTETIEAFTVVKALTFAKDMRLKKIVIEGDVLGIINAIKSPSPNLSSIGNLIDEARIVSKDFEVCLIQHVRGNANMAAHTLAKQALAHECIMNS
ncbi:hypothetical protein PTKIN_Ptkin01aG0401500 [Pterospermum kingtungense]